MSNLSPWRAVRTGWCTLLALVLIVDSSAQAELMLASGNSSGPIVQATLPTLAIEPTTKWDPFG